VSRPLPANKGRRYPADPPRIEEIVAVMRAAGDRTHGRRSRALIVVLWRAGLRISDALALAESDLEVGRGALIIRAGKGGKRSEVGMDDWDGSSCVRGLSAASSCRWDRSSA
jgi:integrase